MISQGFFVMKHPHLKSEITRGDGGSVRTLSVGIEKHLRTFQRLAGIDADIL